MRGDDLRRWRAEHGIGLRELARMLDVSPTTLMRWEKGDIGIRHPAMLALALTEIARRRADATDPSPECGEG
jgi:transcriptional regulator with XRE-family HTH domain